MPFTCAVPDCKDRTSTRHRFPNPNKFLGKFNNWLEIIGNDHLKSLEPSKVFHNYRICHRHFATKNLSTNMYLNPEASPTLHLPARCVTARKPETEAIVMQLEESTTPSTSAIQNMLITETDSEILQSQSQPLTLRKLDRSLASTSGLSNKQSALSTTPTSTKPVFEFPRKISTVQKSAPILQEIGVSRVSELTPKAQRIYKRNRNLSKSVHKLRLRTRRLRQNLLAEDETIENATSSLAPSVANFIKTQIRLGGKKAKGRRFNLDDKILGIVLQKQSSKSYNLLSKIFALPSRKTNMALLNRIPLKAGVNAPIFDNLKVSVENLNQRDRVSILIFNEMSIEPQIIANKNLMEFEGFEDSGDSKTSKIADHAAVFLVKGITKKWKKPIVYTFCQGTTKTVNLAKTIITIIKECQKSGLKIVATVSDQGCTNIAAINYLCKNYGDKNNINENLKIYCCNEEPIVHIYDPPHLLKGIRNNLLTKNLMWKKEDQTICAKWEHIVQTYEDDNGPGELRALPRITESHIDPKKMKKMKVSVAAQIFSHSMASVMTLLCRKGVAQDPKSAETATILKFFDTLFDSVNGGTRHESHGKKYKCAVSKSSNHLSYWSQTRQSLSKMYFIDGNGTKSYPPSLKNWTVTLNGFAYISKRLEQFNISYFCPREINQDTVENFFGQLRQHGGRNINPNTSSFKNYFKTLLINNLVSKHSIGANCEADNNINLIDNVKNFVTQGVPEVIEDEEVLSILKHKNIDVKPWTYIDKISLGYVGGFITKYLKSIGKCSSCKNNVICRNAASEWNDLIIQKEYNVAIPQKLKKCTPEFLEGIAKIYSFTLQVLPDICEKDKCIQYLQLYLRDIINFNFRFKCDHTIQLEIIIIEKFCYLVCYNWALGLSKVLSRKEMKINCNDKIYIQAKEYSERRIKKK